MFRPLAFLMLAVLCPTVAATATVPLGDATVSFDAANWTVTGMSGRAALMFTCVAPDCPGQPVVLAVATAASAEGQDFFDVRMLDAGPLAAGSPLPGAIAFEALTGWSGCRALDHPVFVATGERDGTAYHFASPGHAGCNTDAELPASRFLELLAGTRPVD